MMRLKLGVHPMLFAVILVGVTGAGCGASRNVNGSDGFDAGGDGGASFDLGPLGETDSEAPVLQALTLEPSNATIFIDESTTPATPATLTYTAALNLENGKTKDVTDVVTIELDDPALGSFAGPVFTSAEGLPSGVKGLTTVVTGTAEGKTGKANVTIVKLRKTGGTDGKRDFYFVVPYNGAPDPARDVLRFGTNIKQVDVAFNMDTTGSMSGSVENLRTNLSSTIFPALAKAIPNVGLSVVDHKDMPVCSHGGGGDFPVKVYQTITTDLKKAQAATSLYAASGGSDGPESQIPSMWHMITGGALSWTGGSVAAHKPAPGTFGGVDFRPGSLPVVVLITDVSWHDAKNDPYCADVKSPPSLEVLKKEFTKVNAKFVDLTSASDESQANELSDATKSNVAPSAFKSKCGSGQCCTGVSGAAAAPTGPGKTCRLNFRHSGGTGVSDGIIAAIGALSVGSQFDVTATFSNDPANEDGVDATQFIDYLRPIEEGDEAQGCPAMTGRVKDTDGDGRPDTFTAVVVGTPVCFEIIPKKNTTTPPKASAQFYNAFIDVLGMPGSVKLDRRSVLFLVPPRGIFAK